VLTDLIKRYNEHIRSWTVDDYEQAGANLRLNAKIIFHNGCQLFIKQIVIEESVFKYAYHFQNQDSILICRWDNAPHWPDIATFPHHRHVFEDGVLVVKESTGGDLEEVFKIIVREYFKS